MTTSPVLVKENSKNSKIGLASTSYVSQSSCPNSCAFKGNGCYYENGPLGIISKRLNASDIIDPTEIARLEANAIDNISGKYPRPLRLHTGGDTITVEGVRLIAAAAERYTAKYNLPVWTYTHEHSISRENYKNISIFRSCETIAQARTAVDEGFGAALVVDNFAQETAYDIGEGLKGIPCPQETGRAKDCVSCKICLNASKLKNRVVLFSAHGARKNTVKRVVGKHEHKTLSH